MDPIPFPRRCRPEPPPAAVGARGAVVLGFLALALPLVGALAAAPWGWRAAGVAALAAWGAALIGGPLLLALRTKRARATDQSMAAHRGDGRGHGAAYSDRPTG